MDKNEMIQQSPSFNEALFESMAKFLGAVWEINLNTSKVKIMHDIYVPRFIGAVWSFNQARLYLSRYAYPEDKKEILRIYDKEFMWSLRKTIISEQRSRFGDNKPHLLRCSLTPRLDENGPTGILYASFAEIEKRVDSQTGTEYIADVIRERDNSKNELKRYLSAVSCGIVQYRKISKELLFVNDTALEILGYASMEQMQRDGFDGIARTVDETDRQKVQDAVASLRNENDSVDFEYRVHRRSGGDLLCLGKARLLLDENGEEIIQRSIIDITESSKTREDYNQSLENMDLLNEVTDSALWYISFTPSGEMSKVFWSKRYRDMLGYNSEEEFPNQLTSWIDSLHPDDKDWVLKIFADTLAGLGLYNPKFRLRKKDGSYLLCKNSARAALYPNGKLRLIVGVMINITEQENEQMDINSRLDVFIGGIKGGLRIVRYEKDFPYFYISKNLFEIQGYEEEEFLRLTDGKLHNNIHDPAQKKHFEELYREFKVGQSFSAKYRVKHKDGHLVWVSDYGKMVQDTKGNRYIYSVVQDIDQEENALLRLAAEKAKYADALTKNSVYNFSFDLVKGTIDDKITTFKGTDLLAMVGLEAPVDYDQACKLILRKFNATVLTPYGERIFSRNGLIKNFAEGKTTETIEYYLPNMDMYIRSMTLLYEDPGSGHLMANIFSLDITEEKKEELAKERALKDAFEAAERANKAKTTFLNSMSHDIRTPMNAIIGFTKLAYNHLDNRALVEDYLGKIKSSSDHLLSLINDVLDMSHIESGKLRVDEAEISLYEVVQNIQNMVQASAQKANLTMIFDTQGIYNDYVLSDSLRLKQVLLNCVSNSLKYTPSGGEIVLKIEELPSEMHGYASYRFIIKDTGVGMSQDFVDHIFEPFSREATSTVSGIQGTGLGMAICKNIVEMMGGTIGVKSKQGEGTEITINLTFRIPARDNCPWCQGVDAVQSQTKGIRDVKILLVEDNELNREIAESLLTECGAIVHSVADGYIAVNMLKNAIDCHYDVILMDVQMPIMDGYEATKRIRTLANPNIRNIPIVAMTANAFEEDRKLAFEAGMNEHLAKPIDINRVIEVINRVIKR